MSEDELESQLRKIAAEVGHFPSNSDLVRLGRGDLPKKIQKSGGCFHWAERIGIPRKWSDSDTGWAGEAAVQETLVAAGYKVLRSSFTRAPYDLLINDVLRVDVKTAAFAEYGHSTGWFYRVGKQLTADLVILWQSDTEVMYPIPWYVCSGTNITVTKGGKRYSKFKNNLSIIDQMVKVRTPELNTANEYLQDKGPGRKPKPK